MKNASNALFRDPRRSRHEWPLSLLTFSARSHGPSTHVRGAAGRSCRASALWGAEIAGCRARFGAATGARNRSRSVRAGARKDHAVMFRRPSL